MNRLVSNNTAFSLMEILMASVIFIISITGIFATLNAVRAPVINKEGALAAAVFSKQVLEALRSGVNQQAVANFYTCSVNQNPCPDFALSVGAHSVARSNLPAGLSWPQILITGVNNNYPNGNPPVLSYKVTCADGINADCTNSVTSQVAHRVDLNINW